MQYIEEEIKKRAADFTRKNKKRIGKELTDTNIFTPEIKPVSIFMAGSPGAGKTESSKNLLKDLGATNVIRIDTDEYREYFEDFDGSNSHLFQLYASTIASVVHVNALNNNQSFVFDSTFHDYKRAEMNIKSSLKRGRLVFILFVYQEPAQAWEFVKKRELVEGRRIRVEDFTEKFCESRKTVQLIKEKFGNKVVLDIIVKNNDGSQIYYGKNKENIDNYIQSKYTKDELKKLLS